MYSKGQNYHSADPEHNLSDVMIRQYYNYISLLKLTNNFERKLSLYEKLNIEAFQGNIAIIGNITQISPQKEELKNKYYFPIIQTTLSKSSFGRDDPYPHKTSANIKRVLAVNKQNYLEIFLLPFNKIISLSKKEKNQFFIFTGLKLYFYQSDIYFCLTRDSSIIQLEFTFYQSVFKIIQTSLESKFAEINLRKVFTDQKVEMEDTFAPNDVRSKILENINDMSIMGILFKINHESYKSKINQKQKEVQLTIIQDVCAQEYTTVGICKIYVRFDKIDEDAILSYIEQGSVFIFKISQIFVGQFFQLSFKINSWKDNMIKVAKNSVKNDSLERKFEDLTVIPIKTLTLPVICRNYYKFHVTQVETKFFHLRVCCERCGNSLMRIGPSEYQCMNQCGIVNGQLKLWVIVGCMDSSYYCELTIEDENAISFFDLQQEAMRIKEQVLREEENKKGLTLYFKRDRQNEDEEYDDAIMYEKNPYLLRILTKCLISIAEKVVVGIPRASIFQNFGNYDQNFRHEFCNSFVKPKELNKKVKMLLNGQFKPFKEKSRFVPQIKVERVYAYSRDNKKDNQKSHSQI